MIDSIFAKKHKDSFTFFSGLCKYEHFQCLVLCDDRKDCKMALLQMESVDEAAEALMVID